MQGYVDILMHYFNSDIHVVYCRSVLKLNIEKYSRGGIDLLDFFRAKPVIF